MNIEDLEKVANRKRINAEAEKLREKVNRETANIKKVNAFTKKVELEMAAKEKESELSQQIAIILETRKEKDRLQERLKSMQNTIDNIEKWVTGRCAPAAGSPRDVTEQDNNAEMRKPTPINKRVGGFVAPKEPSQRLAKEPNYMLYDLFSDSDTEIELIPDPAQINRHFEAISRGESISPMRFKRRIAGPASLDVPQSSSQLKEAKTKRKNKRSDNKAKKRKNVE